MNRTTGIEEKDKIFFRFKRCQLVKTLDERKLNNLDNDINYFAISEPMAFEVFESVVSGERSVFDCAHIFDMYYEHLVLFLLNKDDSSFDNQIASLDRILDVFDCLYFKYSQFVYERSNELDFVELKETINKAENLLSNICDYIEKSTKPYQDFNTEIEALFENILVSDILKSGDPLFRGRCCALMQDLTNNKIYLSISGSSIDYSKTFFNIPGWSLLTKVEDIQKKIIEDFYDSSYCVASFVHLTERCLYYSKKSKINLYHFVNRTGSIDSARKMFSCCERKLLCVYKNSHKYKMIIRFIPCSVCDYALRGKNIKVIIPLRNKI